MPTYGRSAQTARKGVGFVRSAVEDAGSLFIKLEQESDLGIDVLLELLRDGRPLNKIVAVQIKSGETYFRAATDECVFPVGSHCDYWLQYPLPVFGIVYVPSQKTAFWVDIKRYLRANPNATNVRFGASWANRFDGASFLTLFVPAIVGGVPMLSQEEALRLSFSDKPDEQYLGLVVLFRKHPNEQATWDRLVQVFVEQSIDTIPDALVHWLAHIPGHGDIWYHGETLTESSRAYARTLLDQFAYPQVVKLLNFIDPEGSISRGSLGQSVEAIISSLPNSSALLRAIIGAAELELCLRESAALILAMNEGLGSLKHLEALARSGSWYATEIVAYLLEHGHVNPY